jgi:endoglucanase
MRLLADLTESVGVSGDEGAVRKIVREQIESVADEIRVDAMGSVLAIRKGSGRNRLRVMVAAHMDEIGFMLVGVESDGSFRLDNVGGVDPRQLPGKPIWIGREKTPGVIGAKPIHLVSADERKVVPKFDGLRIDVGETTKEGATKKAKLGDRATFATPFQRLGPILRGKALDDRLGVATLIELFKDPPRNIDLLAAFTTQEEVGLRGARVAAHALNPDVAIAVDCTPANDLPTWDGEPNEQYNARLGAGPAIYIADRATLSHPKLVEHFIKTAEAERIPFQIRQPGGGGTDAGAMHLAHEGIPSISISTPARYLHTAIGLARVDDWRETVRLVYAGLAGINRQVLAR